MITPGQTMLEMRPLLDLTVAAEGFDLVFGPQALERITSVLLHPPNLERPIITRLPGTSDFPARPTS